MTNYEEMWKELKDRLDKSKNSLEYLEGESDHIIISSRLGAKKSGIMLAMSYMEDMERTNGL